MAKSVDHVGDHVSVEFTGVDWTLLDKVGNLRNEGAIAVVEYAQAVYHVN